MLLTNLADHVQPIVRYERPDVVAIDAHPCRCGRTLTRMSASAGARSRVAHADRIHTPGFHRSRVRTRTSAAASPASAIPAEIRSSSLRPDANAAS